MTTVAHAGLTTDQCPPAGRGPSRVVTPEKEVPPPRRWHSGERQERRSAA